MKADPAAQERLLEVQDLDSRIDGLDHRLRTLAERAVERDATARAKTLHDQLRDLEVVVADLQAEQEKADADVEQVKARRERDRSRMESGQIADPKALERMQAEMVSLERRIGTLEDEELEVMERLEAATADRDEVAARHRHAGEEAASAASAAEAIEAEIAGQKDDIAAERGRRAEGLPEDLLALYDRLRAAKGGVGAALLQRRECGGCRLTLDAAELAQIAKAPVDEVVRCEECQRILVRTAESGL